MLKKLASFSLATILAFQLCIVSAETDFIEDFESGGWATVIAGTDLSAQTINGWVFSAKDKTNSTFNMIADPNNASGKSLRVAMSTNPAWDGSGISASKTFTPITGVDSNGIVNVSYRFMTFADFDGRAHYIKFSGGNKTIATLGLTQAGANAAVTDWLGNPLSLVQYSTDFGLYFNGRTPDSTKTNDLPKVDGKLPFVKLESYIPKNVTKYVKLSLDFTAKTIKVYYSGAPIADDATPTFTAPFSDINATSIDKVTLGGGYYAYKTLAYDDIKAQIPTLEEPAVYGISNATYTDTGSQVSVTSSATVPANFSSANILVAGYDANDELAFVDVKPYTVADLIGGNIEYTNTLDTQGKTISKVRVFLWDSLNNISPNCDSIDATKQL